MFLWFLCVVVVVSCVVFVMNFASIGVVKYDVVPAAACCCCSCDLWLLLLLLIMLLWLFFSLL